MAVAQSDFTRSSSIGRYRKASAVSHPFCLIALPISVFWRRLWRSREILASRGVMGDEYKRAGVAAGSAGTEAITD